LKHFKGKFPVSRDEERVGNSDCRIPMHGRELLDIVEDYVHAVRVEDNITTIRPNTMYMYPESGEAHLNIIRTINTVYDDRAPGNYPELITHMNPERDDPNMFGELKNFVLSDHGPSIDAVQINVNGYRAGFYLPTKNSWIVGAWTWHIHYVTIILKYVFPQMVGLLGLAEHPESIGAEKRKGITTSRIEVTVGADPELEVTKDNRVIRADTNLGIRDYTSTEIGCDGAAAQLEFRPQPGTPKQVVKNIRHLVKKFSETWDQFDLTDEGARFPLGGHIHVGVGHRMDAPRDYVMMLDDFIGRPTIDLSGTARGSYKALGMVRSQPHGIEYRSCPASVFQNPMITYIVFKLTKNLSEKYFNKEDIMYNDVPTVQDYIMTGGLSEREAKYFHQFCGNYKPVASIRASWKVKPAPVRTVALRTPLLEFHDDWSSENRENLTRVFEEGIQVDNEYIVTFYGLARERGSVMTTLHLDGASYYEPVRSKWSGDRHLNVGVSYDLRKYGVPNSLVREIVTVVKSLIEQRERELN